MAVPQNEVRPNGCPQSNYPPTGERTIWNCLGPTENSVCQEFCPRTRRHRSASEMLESLPTPTNPLEALTLLLTHTASKLESGELTTEEAQKLWTDIGEDLKKK